MPKTVLHIDNVSKLYRLGQVGTGTLAHDLNRWWAKVRGKEDPFLKIGETNRQDVHGQSEYVWALKDINLEVKQGEVLGIIGKNGAGKSTLLKILARVTGPTTGQVKIKGRIGSLLEVGTGFHPELTGRENIFLNGAILGMTRAEVRAKFDAIVDFAGIERYIDTPVKRYSSGMYVRLAFAVAAFLEPEILIVDEVLAVGDAEFQRKAIGKMQDVSKGEGRTVLFVSHNMASIKSLCQKAMVLENGLVKLIADTETAVSHYMKGDSEVENRKSFGDAYDFEDFRIEEIAVNGKGKTYEKPISEEDEIELHTRITIKNNKAEQYHVTYHLYNELGEAMFSFSNSKAGVPLKNGLNEMVACFPKAFLQSGSYYLSIFVVKDKKQPVYNERDILSFTVVDRSRDLGVYMGREPGYIMPNFVWKQK